MAFKKPAIQKEPLIAWSDFWGDRRERVVVAQYYQFPGQEEFDDPKYRPGAPVAAVVVRGKTAEWCMDPVADSLYTRLKDVVMRGLQGSLNAEEVGDVEGLEKLATITADAQHQG